MLVDESLVESGLQGGLQTNKKLLFKIANKKLTTGTFLSIANLQYLFDNQVLILVLQFIIYGFLMSDKCPEIQPT